MPGNAHAVGPELRHAYTPLSPCINFQKRFLAYNRSLIYFGVGGVRPLACWCMCDADEYHVPVRACPSFPFTVSRNPLLLRPGIDSSVDECVRHPSAAGPPMMLVQHQIAPDVHTSERHGLRNGPLHRASCG